MNDQDRRGTLMQTCEAVPDPTTSYRIPDPTRSLTRKRAIELFGIAQEICRILDGRVRKDEGCAVRRYAEELWSLPKEGEK